MLETLFATSSDLWDDLATRAPGPGGRLPLTETMLRDWPSGDLFGLTQNAGMGWDPARLGAPEVLILSTQGGLRGPDGAPIALGYHTGHWEVGLLVEAAARELTAQGCTPFAGACSDPCDGRSQGTVAMMDSLAWRNDAASIFRRLIRSLPRRTGVIGVATCDKGLPAMMMALAASDDLPVVLVPGGVTLPAEGGEDAGKVQSLGARFAHHEVTLEEAQLLGCKACGSPGGGCQFLGTAASSQVVGEALGLALPHSALAPSGSSVWRQLGRDSAMALLRQAELGLTAADLVTPAAVHNAMMVHAAFGASTNLLLHLPAVARAAGLPAPTVADWLAVNRATPRLVDVLPNGPIGHPTVRVFLAGGVPEVMLHLRDLDLLELDARTAGGEPLGDMLDQWRDSPRRQRARELLVALDGVSPEEVIHSPAGAAAAGLTPTVAFPTGNLAPEGSVIKATAIDPAVVDTDGVYRHQGPARVFVSERDAIAAIKAGRIEAGQVMIVCSRGPLGSGMEETYQLTAALRYLPFGKHVALVTDARFSGVSTGACVGHVGPEALAGGPLGKVIDDDVVRIEVDRIGLSGSVDLVGHGELIRDAAWGAGELARRAPRPDLAPDPDLPPETRLWAALQAVGGGTWGGCVYDVEAIVRKLSQ